MRKLLLFVLIVLMPMATMAEVRTYTLTSGWSMGAGKQRAFPTPLLYIGNKDYLEMAISAGTFPDTLYYRLLKGSNPMDTLTTFGAEQFLTSGQSVILSDFGYALFFGVRVRTHASYGVTDMKITVTTTDRE